MDKDYHFWYGTRQMHKNCNKNFMVSKFRTRGSVRIGWTGKIDYSDPRDMFILVKKITVVFTDP